MFVVVEVPIYKTYEITDHSLEEWMKLEDREKWDILDSKNTKVIDDENNFDGLDPYSDCIVDEYEREEY